MTFVKSQGLITLSAFDFSFLSPCKSANIVGFRTYIQGVCFLEIVRFGNLIGCSALSVLVKKTTLTIFVGLTST